MSLILVTPCTNRKIGVSKEDGLSAANIPRGSQEAATNAWAEMITDSPRCAVAQNFYGGRGFQEAVKTSTETKTPLWIISAGLGLINSQTLVPAYNLTVTPGTPKSIQSRICEGVFRADLWWSDLNANLNNGVGLADVIRGHSKSLIVVTLSSAYSELVAKDLTDLSSDELSRVRIVGLVSNAELPEKIRSCWIPYDYRFDGAESPIPGTRADYPQRVSRHFIEFIQRNGELASLEDHRRGVLDILKHMPFPEQKQRRRGDDQDVREVILKRWHQAEGSSARMLRILRDDELMSCEQGRFAKIFRSIKKESGI